MPDQPVPFNSFRGLNLAAAPDSLGDQCLDGLNAEIDVGSSRVRSRDGFDNYSASANANDWAFIARFRGDQGVSVVIDAIVVSDSAGISYLDRVSGVATSIAAYVVTDAVQFGTPLSKRLYVNRGATNTTAYISDVGLGPAATAPTATVDGTGGRAMPKGGVMTVQEVDNRLVVNPGNSGGGPNGVTSSGSHVWFSAAGDPLTWTTTNYVQVTPGDGEDIQAMCSWRGNVFVFKQTKMFVFYGNSTDASDNPVFNYRAVSLPSGLVGKCVTVGDDGVYFVTANGVYVTTGDVPSLISTDLAPMGTDAALPTYLTGFSGRWVDAQTIHFSKRRLYVSLKNAATPGTLVYDLDANNWLPWSIKPAMFLTWGGESSQGLLYFVGDTIGKHVYRFKSSFTNDDGAAITSYYRTGFYDLGDGDQKTIHNVDVWGTGTINYSTARDFNATMGTARSVTLGTSPAIGYGRTQPSADTARGNLFSHKFADSSGGAWSVQRVVQNVQAKRPPGPKGT